MKRFLFLVVASCVVFWAQAQRVYFMYLQSENATPFFVKMGDKVYSSTATGYVILSSLKDSTYSFSVGFPGGKAAETRFSVPLKEGDRGFLLKHFQDGLALFDLQSLDVIKSTALGGVPENVQVVARTDAFTRSLSEAADDESLLYTTVALKKETPKKEVKTETLPETKPDAVVEKKPEPKTDVVAVVDSGAAKSEAEKPAIETAKATEPARKEEPKADSAVAAAPVKPEEVKKEEAKEEPSKADVAKEEVKKDSVASQPQQPVVTVAGTTEPQKAEPAAVYKRSEVTKRSESSTTEGFGLVFTDRQEDGTDTIRLLIPNPKKPFVEEATAKETATQELEAPVADNRQAKGEGKEVEEKKNAADPAKGEKDAESNKRTTKKTFKDFTSDIFKAPQESSSEAKAERRKVEEEKAEEPVKTAKENSPASTKKAGKKTFKDVTSEIFKAPQEAAAPAVKVENSACTALATEKDFLKVRKNMAAETNDERMIDEAKVFFRSKCFTTEQIRNLSGLFLTSAAKYQFYDAAYKHVTDPSAFPSLESEIKDPYYLKRFKALIGQ